MAPERKRKHQLDDRPPQIMLETVAPPSTAAQAAVARHTGTRIKTH